VRLIQKVSGVEEFVRVAESLSFARAAASLGLTNSGVSKAIRLLEGRLGVRLLNRTTRNVSLTDDGNIFYERASKWIAELEEMQSSLSPVDADLTGSIRIEMPVTYGRVLFMPHLARFLELHPRLTVEVRMSDLYADLVAEGIDLAIRIGELPDSDLVARPLGRVSLGTFACPRCLDIYGRPQRPQDLLSHRLISFVQPSRRAKTMLYVDGDNEIVIDAAHAVAAFNNGEAMTDATINGIGIAQLPVFHAQEALDQGRLAQVLEGWDAPGPSVQLVYASRKHLSRRVSVLIDFITNEVKRTGGV
jgi:DNA-binding transcriptional LysR family regulator